MGQALLFKQSLLKNPYQWQLSTRYLELGFDLARLKKLPEAVDAYQQARKIRHALADQEPSNFQLQADLLDANERLSMTLKSADRDEAIDVLRESVMLIKHIVVLNPSNDTARWEVLSTYRELNQMLSEQGKVREASEVCRDEIDFIKNTADRDAKDFGWREALSRGYVGLGDTLKFQSKLPEALDAYQQGRAVDKTILEREPADFNKQAAVAFDDEKVAEILNQQGTLEQVLDVYQERLQLVERLAAAFKNDQLDHSWRKALIEAFYSGAMTRTRLMVPPILLKQGIYCKQH